MLISIFIATLVLWVAFIAITKILDDNERKWADLTSVSKKIAVAIFLIIDTGYNFTYANILFWEFADWDRKTLTLRLKHILHSGLYSEGEWRFKLALFMCKYMIEPWDFGHCSLGRLK